MISTASIEWRDARAELPDSDTTLLCGFADGEVELGFHDGEVWRSVDQSRFNEEVEFFADLPEVPNRFRINEAQRTNETREARKEAA